LPLVAEGPPLVDADFLVEFLAALTGPLQPQVEADVPQLVQRHADVEPRPVMAEVLATVLVLDPGLQVAEGLLREARVPLELFIGAAPGPRVAGGPRLGVELQALVRDQLGRVAGIVEDGVDRLVAPDEFGAIPDQGPVIPPVMPAGQAEPVPARLGA